MYQQVLQQTLPSQVFTLLIQRMREYGNRSGTSAEPQINRIEDFNDDLE